MAENKEKTYFWLKLSNRFFDDLGVKALRRSPGGDTYLVIFLKLALKALESGGRYDLQGIFENPVIEIALDLDEQEQAVGEALSMCRKYGLIDMSDTDILIPYVTGNIGKLTSAAVRQARSRENRKALPGGQSDDQGDSQDSSQDGSQDQTEAPASADEQNKANTRFVIKNDAPLHCHTDVTPMSHRVRDIYRDRVIYNNNTNPDGFDHSEEGQEVSGKGEGTSIREETSLTQEAVDKVLAAWNNLHDKRPEMIAKASRIQYMGGTWLDMEKLVKAYGMDTVCEMIAYIDQTRPYRNIDYYRQQGKSTNKLKIGWFISDATGKRQEIIDDYEDAKAQAEKVAEAAAKEAAAREAEKQRMGMTQPPKKPSAPAAVRPAAKPQPARGSLFDLFK